MAKLEQDWTAQEQTLYIHLDHCEELAQKEVRLKLLPAVPNARFARAAVIPRTLELGICLVYSTPKVAPTLRLNTVP